jgi:hypothetical protein
MTAAPVISIGLRQPGLHRVRLIVVHLFAALRTGRDKPLTPAPAKQTQTNRIRPAGAAQPGRAMAGEEGCNAGPFGKILMTERTVVRGPQ